MARRMMSWERRAMENRIQRAVEDGQLPADGAQLPPAAVATLPTLRRDVDEPTHPHWFRIFAYVKHADGTIHPHYVTEERHLHRATALCSQYGYRAVVQNCHGKIEYDNRKDIEIEGA